MPLIKEGAGRAGLRHGMAGFRVITPSPAIW